VPPRLLPSSLALVCRRWPGRQSRKAHGSQFPEEVRPRDGYLFLGAGSAVCSAMAEEGLTLKQAQSRVYMFDINGLLETSRKDPFDFQKPYAHKHVPTRDFVAAIDSIKPATIIGVSTMGGTFTKDVVETLARLNERPVIVALSNPTEHAECTPEQAYAWSRGKAIYAAGVQFPPGAIEWAHFPARSGKQFLYPPPPLAWRSSRHKLSALRIRFSSSRRAP
jgi:malate dehydrogenase (oxaloacetate-decarboxylating)(NADP+)